MNNDALLAQFTVEHFDRNSIGAHRRAATLRVLSRVAVVMDLRAAAGSRAGLRPQSLADITPSDVMAWQASEIARGLKPNSVRNLESMLHAFLKWLHLAQQISFERYAGLKSVPPARGVGARLRPRPYKRTEIQDLREALSLRFPLIPTDGRGMYALRQYREGVVGERSASRLRAHARRLQFEAQVSLALEEGLRMSEVHSLTIARLHPDNESVVVASAKSKPGELREREVPYMDHSRECVREWLAFRSRLKPSHEVPWLALTPGLNLDPQAREAMRKSLEVLDRVTAPTVVRWHRLRHTFATERLRSGTPLEQLQVMMGHANLQQTLAYAEIVNADVVTEAERTAVEFAKNLGLAAA